MKLKLVLAFLLPAITGLMRLTAQTGADIPLKTYQQPEKAGEVQVHSITHEMVNDRPCVIWHLEVPASGQYVVQTFGNFSSGAKVFITSSPAGEPAADIDPGRARYYLEPAGDGWQIAQVIATDGSRGVDLKAGKTDLYFYTDDESFALTDQISVTLDGNDPVFSTKANKALDNIHDLIGAVLPDPGPKPTPTAEELAIVLPNPQGNYSHQVNEPYTYSTFNYVYLAAGTTVTFRTSSAPNRDPVLHLFLPSNPDTYSWSHDDINSGPNPLDAQLTVTAPVTGYYVLLVRPYWDNQNFTTNITRNGGAYLNNTPAGGRRYDHSSYNGNRNFFTAYMLGDTRLFTLNGSAGHVRGYNDDYWGGGGNFNWGLHSRVKKNFPTNITRTYICAYSTFSTGFCDTYMGNLNGTNHGPGGAFPLLKADDCIQTAPFDWNYNCISWSGGITNDWIWPPSDVRWQVPGNGLASFDNYYRNIPNKRYIGAWNYTRAGANVNNSVVDLWRTTADFTHASVKKPGNNNPHGYDWESKPGATERTLHPRNDLAGALYGAVSNYYIHDGTFARNAAGLPLKNNLISSDADAVRMGLAIFDEPTLSRAADEKLKALLDAAGENLVNQFNFLYDNWKQTWQQNSFASNPQIFTRTKEYGELLAFCQNKGAVVLPAVFNRYLQGDFLSTPLLWTLTEIPYAPLMNEVKTDINNREYDEAGRFIIRSTHDIHVYYIEKILAAMAAPEVITAGRMQITISPNPVSDRFNIDFKLPAEGRVSITAVSSQTGSRMVILRETSLSAGMHRYTASARQFAGGTGDMISVQVIYNGQITTSKLMVGQ